MNNLTTRKIVLGMLMALVLAFSVQSIADALTFSTSRTGDLETVVPNEDFSISFSARLASPRVKPAYDDYRRTPRTQILNDAVGEVTYYDPVEPGETEDYADQESYDTVHYYDQESINVAIVGDARIIRVGSRDVSPGASFSMYERSHNSYDGAADHEKFSGRVSLRLEPTDSPGVVTITVTDTTDTPDAPTTGKSDPITFTIYVVDFNTNVDVQAAGFLGLTDNYAYASDQYDEQIRFSVTPVSVPVKIEVVEGPGRLYVQKRYANQSPNSESRSNREINISSTVGTTGDTGGSSGVYLDANGGTNRIRITVPDVDHEPVTAIYVYGTLPSIQIVSGNDQTGAFGGRLEEPFVVRVNDERGRGVPMAIVTFSGGVAGSRFLPVPGTTVHVDADDDWASTFMHLPMTRSRLRRFIR